MSFFSKNTLLGGIDNYANTPPTELYAKKTVSAEGANANLLLNSRDRNTGTLTNKKVQSYNNFVLQKGFPILQGQINSLKVNEITIPVPPNFNSTNLGFSMYAFNNVGTILEQADFDGTNPNIIAPGFYTGNQIATRITALLPFANFGTGGNTVVYNNDGTFTWTVNLDAGAGQVGWGVCPLLPAGFVGTVNDVVNIFGGLPPEKMGFIWTMGFNNYYSSSFNIPTVSYKTGVAPLSYTEYIDVCSDVLTQYQELTDTSTDSTNPNHIICRVYIANEVSLPQVDASGSIVIPGTQYTKIHRQFKNAKVLRWNGQNSIDRVDLQLYDDLGRPLYFNPNGNDDFQITFSAVEL